MTTPNSDTFEQNFPVSLCWECGSDMAYCAGHRAWECTCGFTLNETFCQVTHVAFECIVFVGGRGLAKRRQGRGYQMIGMHLHLD